MDFRTSFSAPARVNTQTMAVALAGPHFIEAFAPGQLDTTATPSDPLLSHVVSGVGRKRTRIRPQNVRQLGPGLRKRIRLAHARDRQRFS